MTIPCISMFDTPANRIPKLHLPYRSLLLLMNPPHTSWLRPFCVPCCSETTPVANFSMRRLRNNWLPGHSGCGHFLFLFPSCEVSFWVFWPTDSSMLLPPKHAILPFSLPCSKYFFIVSSQTFSLLKSLNHLHFFLFKLKGYMMFYKLLPTTSNIFFHFLFFLLERIPSLFFLRVVPWWFMSVWDISEEKEKESLKTRWVAPDDTELFFLMNKRKKWTDIPGARKGHGEL